MRNKNMSISAFLKAHPSYLKWGVTRLAEKFGVEEDTISTIVRRLKSVKREYIGSLA